MSKSRARRQLTDYEETTKSFWDLAKQQIGHRPPLFVDTAAILASFVPSDDVFREFFEKELYGFRLCTSAFVIAETARRLVKWRQRDPFTGPAGERDSALAAHVVQSWIQSQNVLVLPVPLEVFEAGKSIFVDHRYLPGWDLVDGISVAVIKGIGGEFIASGDRGFRQFGLTLAPSDAYELHCKSKWLEVYD